MNGNPKIYSKVYFLTAGECDAEGRMPLTLLTSRIIESATCHANSLGIGYADLIKLDLAWVLSRVSIEIDDLPGINLRLGARRRRGTHGRSNVVRSDDTHA